MLSRQLAKTIKTITTELVAQQEPSTTPSTARDAVKTETDDWAHRLSANVTVGLSKEI